MSSDLGDEMGSIARMTTLGPELKRALSGRLYFELASGWVSWISAVQRKSFPLCWLPTDQRGVLFSSRGSSFFVASDATGRVTIIDFAPMLDILRRTHVIE
jgi:hypothetical protein